MCGMRSGVRTKIQRQETHVLAQSMARHGDTLVTTRGKAFLIQLKLNFGFLILTYIVRLLIYASIY